MYARLVAMIVASWFLAAPAFGQQSILYFKSEPGDWVGQGQELTLTSDDTVFVARRIYRNGVSFWIRNPSNWWSASFGPPAGMELVEGSYENATRWPFQEPTVPGLSFSGNGRGCNRLTGRFEVLEAVYDLVTDEVISFAVDFEQHCEGWMPPLYGSIRFNSSIPLPVLIPPRITILDPLNREDCVEATGPDGATVSLAGSSSTPEPVDYLWSTSTGGLGTGTEFSFQLGVDGTAEVTLTIEDLATGEQANASLAVCVSDTTPPQVTILSPIEGETFVGEEAELSVQVSDLVDQTIGQYDLFVGNSTTVPLDVATGASGIKLFRKIKDQLIQVDIKAEAQDFSGNRGSATVTVFREHDMGQ